MQIVPKEDNHQKLTFQCHYFPGQFGSPPQQGGVASFNAFGAQPAAPAQNTFDPFGSAAPQPAQQTQPVFAAFGTPPQQQQHQPPAQPQQQTNFFDAFGSPPASSGGFNAFAPQTSSGQLRRRAGYITDVCVFQDDFENFFLPVYISTA